MASVINLSQSKMAPRGVLVGASATNQVLCEQFAPRMDARDLLRIDILVGRSLAATGVTCTLQDSSGYGIWNTVKASSAISASTNRTCTVDDATDIITSVGHGFLDGQAIAFYTTGTMPVGLDPAKVYYVKYIDANSFYIAESAGGIIADLSSTGTGTLTASVLRVVSISLNNAVSGDQSVLPVRSQLRVVANTGAGDALQVMNIVAMVGA